MNSVFPEVVAEPTSVKMFVHGEKATFILALDSLNKEIKDGEVHFGHTLRRAISSMFHGGWNKHWYCIPIMYLSDILDKYMYHFAGAGLGDEIIVATLILICSVTIVESVSHAVGRSKFGLQGKVSCQRWQTHYADTSEAVGR